MTDISHSFLVMVAKTHGLFYLIGFFILALIYTFWPSNKKRFQKAATSIIEDEDRPCR